MIWDNPGFFWLLLLIPLMYGAHRYVEYIIKNRRKHYFSDELFSRLQAHRKIVAIRVRRAFFYAGFFFLVVALAGPQIGTEVREVQRDRLDVLIALDLSLSMKAEDVRPSRLEKARFEINRLLPHLHNDRIGLVVFTGHAMLHCPLTTDYSAFRMFLDIADPEIMPSTTTDFRSMLEEALSSFESSATGSSEHSGDPARVLLIFSDGEDHVDQYEAPLQQLLEKNVFIFTVGIGTEDGGRIPRYHPETGAFEDFHRDRQGQVVTTRLEPELLRNLANRSGGQYFQISRTAHNIEGFIRQIDQLERSTFATEEVTRYQNRYAVPAFFSLLCFVISMLIPGYKSNVKQQN